MIERFLSLKVVRFKSIKYQGDECEIIKAYPNSVTV